MREMISDKARERWALISTPRASDMAAGGHGDTGRMGTLRHMLATPRAGDANRGADHTAKNGKNLRAQMSARLPTPTSRDCRSGKASDATWDRPQARPLNETMERARSLTPAAKGNLTAPSMMKWAGARALAEMLASHGLSGTAALPVLYGWMMGYPPGWLSRALRSAVLAGRLRPASSSRPSATPSSRKSPKSSAEPS